MVDQARLESVNSRKVIEGSNPSLTAKMRIIFLNCWHGKIRNRLLNFIEENASKTDIFVFSEVAPEIFPVFSGKLVNFSVPNLEISDHLPLILTLEL